MGGLRSRIALCCALATSLALLAGPASALAGTKSKSATLTATNQVISVKPRCPRGQQATGGGFLTAAPTATTTIAIFESRKIGQRSWQVSAQQTGGPEAVVLTGYVYCDAGAPKTKAKSASTGTTGTPGIFAADASCGSAGKAQAGAFLSPVPLPAGNGSVLESFRATGKVWRTRHLGGQPASFTSYAYCAKAGVPSSRSRSTVSALNAVPVSVQSRSCAQGTKALAGGFSQPNGVYPNGLYGNFFESRRIGRTWKVSARHIGLTPTTLTATAYCA
jgi:hypothetical protein